MKLFYYQRPDKLTNFGDLLNTWLWQKLLPNFFDHDPSITFIGTGTLLNHLLPQRTTKAQKLIIFSTGAGYEKNLTAIPEHWKIYCVRGFLTAQKLGLPKSMVVTDGGVLIRRVFEASATKKQGFAFMPHIHHARYAGQTWQKICQEIGFSYIDPGWPVEKVLEAIAQTETLITEAMHGAITADALRIPWIPVITSARILEFKWHDWCSFYWFIVPASLSESDNCPLSPCRTRYPFFHKSLRLLGAILHPKLAKSSAIWSFSTTTSIKNGYSLSESRAKVRTVNRCIRRKTLPAQL